MRALLSKIVTGSMIASAALLVSACGGSEPAAENTVVTDLNATDMLDGTVTDNMTAIDGAMGDNMAMSNEAEVTNGL